MLRSIAVNHPSPAQVVRELNHLIHADLKAGLFITLFYAVIDVPKKIMTFASAGHNPGLLWRAKENSFQSLTLDPPCLPLGLDKTDIFERLVKEKKVSLAPGDVVVLYTDGVTEAMNADRDEFGESGLQACLQRQRAPQDADAVIQSLDEDLNRFCGDFPQNDDIAAVVIKVD